MPILTHASRRSSVFVLALGLALATSAPATAQEDEGAEPLPLATALTEMSDDALVTVEAPPEGFSSYQFGDDPTTPAQLSADYATVTSASAGLFLFGDEVALACDDAAVLCSSPEDAPLPDLYFGMSMTFAGDIPLDGVPGQIINYSFPHFDPSGEPFEELPQFPGDTWQGMNRVAVAESRSPFALAPNVFSPADGWQNGTQHVFGVADGRQIWVFVPFGASPTELEDMEAAINTALAEDGVPGGALADTLPQRIADWISMGRWSVAVHVHQGDFGRELPSTITAVPPTPRLDTGLPMPTDVTLIGSEGFGFGTGLLSPTDPAIADDGVDVEPADADADPPVVEPADDPAPTTDDAQPDPADSDPAESAADQPSSGDDAEAVDAGTGDDGGGPPTGLILGGTGIIVVAGVALTVGRRRKGELQREPMVRHVDDGGAAAAEFGLVVPVGVNTDADGNPIHREIEFDYERDDGTRVTGFGTEMIGGQITYAYPDGTMRRDQEGPRARTVEIAHPDGTREVWTGTEHYARSGPRTWVQQSSYTRYDAVGDVIEEGDTDTHPWPEDP